MIVVFEDGRRVVIANPPLCRRCGHEACPCCPGDWCDVLVPDEDGGNDMCCGGACDIPPDEWLAWEAATTELFAPYGGWEATVEFKAGVEL